MKKSLAILSLTALMGLSACGNSTGAIVGKNFTFKDGSATGDTAEFYENNIAGSSREEIITKMRVILETSAGVLEFSGNLSITNGTYNGGAAKVYEFKPVRVDEYSSSKLCDYALLNEAGTSIQWVDLKRDSTTEFQTKTFSLGTSSSSSSSTSGGSSLITKSVAFQATSATFDTAANTFTGVFTVTNTVNDDSKAATFTLNWSLKK